MPLPHLTVEAVDIAETDAFFVLLVKFQLFRQFFFYYLHFILKLDTTFSRT